MRTKFLFLISLIGTSTFAAPIRDMMATKLSQTENTDNPIPTAEAYIQDGLIAMWDGIENAGVGVHDEDASTWTDLCGTHDIKLNANVQYFWGENYFHYNGVGKATAATSRDIIQAISNGAFSVQCVIKDRSDWSNVTSQYGTQIFGGYYSTFAIFLTPQRERSCIGCYIGTGYSLTTEGYPEQNFVFSATLSGRTQRHYLNGTYKNMYTVNREPKQQDIGFGLTLAHWGGTPHISDIYAIRIYSRTLSEDEIAYNSKIDKKRFKLP